MKPTYTLLLATIATLSLSACQNSPINQPTTDAQQQSENAANAQEPGADSAGQSQIAKLLLACSPCFASDDIENCKSDVQIKCDMETLSKLAESKDSLNEFFKIDYKLYEKNIKYLTYLECVQEECIFFHADTETDEEIAQYLEQIIKIQHNSAQMDNISDADKQLTFSLIDLSTLKVRENPDIAKLKQALADGANVNANLPIEGGQPAIFYVVNNEEIVKLLINSGADINIKDANGKTPAFYADNKPMLATLASLGADLKVKDNKQNSLLHIARDSDSDSLQYLIEAGLDVNAQNADGETPIFRQFSTGECTNSGMYYDSYDAVLLDVDNIQLLVKAGADINAKDKQGNTILSKEIYEYYCRPDYNSLKDMGAKLKFDSKQYLNALKRYYAAFETEYRTRDELTTRLEELIARLNEHDKLIRELLNEGLDVKQRDDDGNTLLFYAVTEDTTKALLKAGCDVNAENKDGKKAWFYGHNEIIQNFDLLAKAGADLNHRDKTGKTALFDRFSYNRAWDLGVEDGVNTVVVEALLKAGADINAKDNDGRTLLFYYHTNDEDFDGTNELDFLLKHGANVNATDNKGMTPLMLIDDVDGVEKLIKAGANVHAKDKSGKSVLDYHAENSDIVDILKKAGAK